MVESIVVLEEWFSIESFSDKAFTEVDSDSLNNWVIISIWGSTSIEWLSSNVIKSSINILFKMFFNENFINAIAEILPSELSHFFALISFTNHIKFILTQCNFSHVQSNSCLGLSNETTSQFIKISEEFRNSKSVLNSE